MQRVDHSTGTNIKGRRPSATVGDIPADELRLIEDTVVFDSLARWT